MAIANSLSGAFAANGFRHIFGRPYAIGPLSVCPVCLSVCDVGALWPWPNGWMDRMPLVTVVGLGPASAKATLCYMGTQLPPPTEKGTSFPTKLFGPCLLWPNGRPSQQLLSSCCSTYCLLQPCSTVHHSPFCSFRKSSHFAAYDRNAW